LKKKFKNVTKNATIIKSGNKQIATNKSKANLIFQKKYFSSKFNLRCDCF